VTTADHKCKVYRGQIGSKAHLGIEFYVRYRTFQIKIYILFRYRDCQSPQPTTNAKCTEVGFILKSHFGIEFHIRYRCFRLTFTFCFDVGIVTTADHKCKVYRGRICIEIPHRGRISYTISDFQIKKYILFRCRDCQSPQPTTNAKCTVVVWIESPSRHRISRIRYRVFLPSRPPQSKHFRAPREIEKHQNQIHSHFEVWFVSFSFPHIVNLNFEPKYRICLPCRNTNTVSRLAPIPRPKVCHRFSIRFSNVAS
jgi:hypothetical protein